MEKLLLDTFEGLSLTDRQKRIFSDVYVSRVVLSKKQKIVFIYMESRHIIPYREIGLLAYALNQQIGKTGFSVLLQEHFVLSEQYTPKAFWEEYKDSILLILKETNVLLFNMLYKGKAVVEGSSFHLDCENDALFKTREQQFIEMVQSVFREKAGLSVEVSVDFSLPVILEEKEGYEVYHRNVRKAEFSQKKEKLTQPAQRDTKGSVSNPPQKTAGREASFSNPAKTQVASFSGKEQGSYAKKGAYSKGKSKWGVGPVDEECFYGRNCEGEVIKIADIQGEIREAVIEGMVISVEEREIRNEKVIYMFSISDFTDSIMAKVFLEKEELELMRENIKKGKFIKLKGNPIYDTFSREITISSVRGMKPGTDTRVKRMDNYTGMKRVELHAHTQMSEMDSVVPVREFVKTAKNWGHKALAITDHGVVQAFPDAAHEVSPDEDFKMLYGVEAYLVDDLTEAVKNDKGQGLRGSYVVFDLETTGIGAKSNEIIEIGAVKVEDGKIGETFSVFVNPLRPIPYPIQQLTGINDSMVTGAGTIQEVLPEFICFCEGCIMVAHNAAFDMGFIEQKAKEQGIAVDYTVIDTVAVARALLPDLKRYKLDTVAKRLGVSLENHHRAVDDATATAEIFARMLERLSDKNITTLEELNKFCIPDEEAIRKMPAYHAVMLAKNETGRVNLYRLVSESHLKYFNRRPRIPKSLFLEWREGLMIGSACEAGELYRALVEEKPEEEIDRLVKFYDYLEIQPIGNNDFMIRDSDRYPQIQDENDLMELNRRIVELGEIYGKLVVATCDVHFMDAEDEVYRRIIMAGKGFADADKQAPLYYRTTEEMLSEFQYLGSKKAEEIVITNTNLIADMVDKIEPCSPRKCPPEIENSDQDLRDICYSRAHEIYGPDLPPVVEERLERELNSIISNGYAVMYIIAQKLVWKSNEDGYLVGSRGSVGSSFAATMSGITEINPLPAHYYCKSCHYYDFDSKELKEHSGNSACDLPDKVCPVCGEMLEKEGHDIPFETFLGFKGNKEPDIDLNFSSEYQSNAHDYTEIIFGAGQTFRAGTVGTLAEKTAYGYVKKYCEEREITKRSAEIERIAHGCEGVRRSTGQHPGGIVVLPMGEEIYTFTPVQHPANDMNTKIITTHFDYHKIDANLLKLDILGHQDPTMIRMLEDLTDVDAGKIRMDDQGVLSLFASTEALGIVPEDIGGCTLGCLGLPEFGTPFVIGMLLDAKPRNFSDLVRISGLSHGTDVWLNNAQYYITKGYCTLSSAICTRDDIMTYLIHMGVENERSFKIMESVRKGKGLDDSMKEDMLACNVPEWYLESCEKIKYMFPKAHAAAYVMMALRVAYFKVYYPLAYYAAFFSIRATSFDYELMCMGKERLEYYMNDYQNRKNELSDKEKSTLEDMKIVQEMYARGFGFVKIDIYRSKANRFQIVDGKLMPSFATIDGLGDKAAEMIEDEASKGAFLSREDFKNRCKVSAGTVETMARLGLMRDLPHTNQISLLDFMEM
ncbi:MAG: PolC-type DNA polymerase III [Lachnospiraceae bacterium]|nr:PolC-type DNA polymerase III [Lachnospiraceae bacterium]